MIPKTSQVFYSRMGAYYIAVGTKRPPVAMFQRQRPAPPAFSGVPSLTQRPATGCGFPALPVRRERERSAEDAESPCRSV